jgi:hypothetical protein
VQCVQRSTTPAIPTHTAHGSIWIEECHGEIMRAGCVNKNASVRTDASAAVCSYLCETAAEIVRKHSRSVIDDDEVILRAFGFREMNATVHTRKITVF